jgi:AcrR family transcriptional regulator
MARTVKLDEREAKRTEILDAAHRLVLTKGYERMTIQDILAELRMSSGAFYHYFASKPEVLDALVERIEQESAAPLVRIVRDPDLSAAEKLRGFFATLDQLRVERQAAVVELLQVWYADSNAIVRQKVEAATLAWRAPLIAEVARQGVREGVFTSACPDQAGEIVVGLAQALGAAHARLMLGFAGDPDERRFVAEALALHVAYVDAIERVLGAPERTLPRADAAAAKLWVRALRNHAGRRTR